MKIFATEGLPTIFTHYVPLPLLAFFVTLTIAQLFLLFKNKKNDMNGAVLSLSFIQLSVGLIYVLQMEKTNLSELLDIYAAEEDIPNFLIVGSIRKLTISASWCLGFSATGPVLQVIKRISNQSAHTTPASAPR